MDNCKPVIRSLELDEFKFLLILQIYVFISKASIFVICKIQKSISNVHLSYYSDFYVNENH